ncbi:MAG: cyclomaltodextrinase [Anaerocolumna sp.]|nr:cyclomaltodextrinase [Anaerocolumna sp.]
MNLHAVYHRQKSNYAYAYNKNCLHLRLRTAKGDCTGVNVVIAEKHLWSEKKSYPMKKVVSDHLFDYYQYEVYDNISRIGYYFELSDGKEFNIYSESGFTKTYDDENAYFHYFQYPYVNEVDILKVPSWVEETVFYEIFVERFHNGDRENDKKDLTPWGELPGPHSFYGGDLKGILQKLDYLEELGINGIYLTPIFTSPSNHKYDTTDYREIDPIFGDKEILCELVDKAHKKGIRIILDGVFNHCSWYFAPFLDVIKKGEASKYKDWFYISCYPVIRYTEQEVSDYSRPLNLSKLNYSIFGTSPNMPKLNTENKEVRKYLLDTVLYWMKEAKIDGWRLDVSDEVSHDFWKEFRKSVKEMNPEALVIGENWHNAYPWLKGDEFDGVMNYPFTKSAIQYFAKEEKRAEDLAADLSEYLMWNYEQTNNAMLNLLDSHDTKRFLNWCKEDERKLRMALLLLFSYKGMPCLYYGCEIGMTGDGDPDCRRTFDWNENNWNKELHSFCKNLISLRKSKKALAYGEITMSAGKDVFYLKRSYKKETIITIINNTNVEIQEDLLKDGTVLLTTGEIKKDHILPAYSGVMIEVK